MSIQNIFNNSRKDEKKSKAYDQVKKAFRHCISGLTESDILELDPYLLGFDQNELIEHELSYVEKKHSKEAAELGINLKEVRKQFYERIGFENSITIKYHLDRFISDEELKEINLKLRKSMPDMFPFDLDESQIRVLYVWGRQKFATEDDIEKSKELLKLDYKVKKIGRG